MDYWINYWKIWYRVYVGIWMDIGKRMDYLERNLNIQRERIDSLEKRIEY